MLTREREREREREEGREREGERDVRAIVRLGFSLYIKQMIRKTHPLMKYFRNSAFLQSFLYIGHLLMCFMQVG